MHIGTVVKNRVLIFTDAHNEVLLGFYISNFLHASTAVIKTVKEDVPAC